MDQLIKKALLLGSNSEDSTYQYELAPTLELQESSYSGNLPSDTKRRHWSYRRVLEVLFPLLALVAAGIFLQSKKIDASTKSMTLFATWNEDSRSKNHYLPAFFDSAKRQNIDVVFIDISANQPTKCLDVSKWIKSAGNIKAVCIALLELQSRWADQLCRRWKCSELQRRSVIEHIYQVMSDDHAHASWKPFMGDLFSEYAATPFWAWIDVDSYLGDFGQLDLHTIQDFDIITLGAHAREEVYLHGQFVAFKVGSFAKHWHKIPDFESPEAFLNATLGPFSDERYYSKLFFDQETAFGRDLDWLVFATRGRFDLPTSAELKAVSANGRAGLLPVNATRADIILWASQPARKHQFTQHGVEIPLNYTRSPSVCLAVNGRWSFFNYDRPLCPLTEGHSFLHAGRKFYYRKGDRYIERFEPMTTEEDQAVWSQHDYVLIHLYQMKMKHWFAWPEQDAFDLAGAGAVLETYRDYTMLWDMKSQADSNQSIFEVRNPDTQ